MKSEHRVILAVALSAAFFVVWFYVLNPAKKAVPPEKQVSVEKEPEVVKEVESMARSEAGGSKAEEPEAVKEKDPQAGLPEKTWTIKNETIDCEWTTTGGIPKSWKVLGYREGTKKDSPLIDLVSGVPQDSSLVVPLSVSFVDSDFSFPKKPRYEIVSADENHIMFRWRSNETEVIKKINFKSGNYLADMEVSVRNLTGRVIKARPVLDWSTLTGKEMKKGGFFGFVQQPSMDKKNIVMNLDGKVRRSDDLSKLSGWAKEARAVYWAGIESRYFLSAIIPRVQGSGLSPDFGSESLERVSPGTGGLWAGVALPSISIPPGETGKAQFSVYSGPKEIVRLKTVGAQLEGAIDYGMFSIISVPILYLLKFFYKIVHNYGVAIILLTIFVKLLLHPINVKSLKSMKAMQQLQPRLKELQNKYKGDKQRLNQETMQLFKAHKVNPMGGCLPMLLQFPIYIALYKVLWNSIELYHAPFFWFYRDLSAPDPYYITPILLGAFMVAQQKLMPSTSADPAQQKMMMIMPIMFSVFMLFLPVGLVVYILVNTVMSVTQQYMYNKGIGMMDLIRGRWRRAMA